jgi:tRNA1Val (adenine37-N6)-methyltransferase
MASVYTEVPAAPAAACWKCRGAGTKTVTVRPTTSTNSDTSSSSSSSASASSTPATTTIPCPVCSGRGTLGRKRGRPADAPPRPTKVFPGWVAVGPSMRVPTPTAADTGSAEGRVAGEDYSPDGPGPGEELDPLMGRWRILQSVQTHKYSTDDVVTAWVAWRASRASPLHPVSRIADIGCGIGSVLLMSAWLHPTAHELVGVEAQATRAGLARRSIRLNGLDGRVSVRSGDLRDPATFPELGAAGAASGAAGGGSASSSSSLSSSPSGFDLVTGTPPYFDVQAGGLPADEEAARCLFEYRGGVEAYALAASRLLVRPGGLFVVVGGALGLERGYTGAEQAGLTVIGRVDCIPKAGKPPLFNVFIMCPRGSEGLYGWDEGVGEGEGGRGGGRRLALEAALGPLAAAELPYPEMRTEAYAASLQLMTEAAHAAAAAASAAAAAEAAAAAAAAPPPPPSPPDGHEGGGGGGGSGDRRPRGPRVPRPRQAARGFHVEHQGRAVRDDREVVRTIVVRDERGERTDEYRRLLWELGKPG